MRRLLFSVLLGLSIFAQAQIPSAPVTADAVHDFAGLFTPSQRNELNDRLIAFSDTTSNRIVVVTVLDLGGMDASEFSFALGEKWGIGDSKFNNGVVILVKPKTEDSYGEVFIAVGYGLEGVIPDAVASQIVNREMIPNFQQGDVYAGVKAAVDVILPLVAGEYTAQEYNDSGDGGIPLIVFIVVAFIIIVFISRRSKKGGGNSGTNGGTGGGPTIITTPRRSRTSYGGFTGGSFGGGSFGGGGGGFKGGFGGGSFGGGGAGGRW